ncbi:MAG TPA: TatD family hydrolase, partial [Cellvibrio sp.]
MPFFDSHCHFDFAEFDADRLPLWQRANALGVSGLLVPGTEPAQWPAAQALSHELPGCYYALGIHPWWISKIATDPLALQFYAYQMSLLVDEDKAGNQPRCIAIGEAGLDKNIDSPIEQQLDLLEWHIDLANQFHLPLIVHSVKTHNELIAHCKKHPPLNGGVVHAFSGSYETAMQLIDLGFYLGVGGTISYERAQKTRATFARVPLEWVLLETDAPDMPLCGEQGQRNSPENLPRIAQLSAELRSETLETITASAWENTR